MKKLSTPEGLKNRQEIIENLPDNELLLNKESIPNLSEKEIDNKKLDKLIKATLQLDSEAVLQKLKRSFLIMMYQNIEKDL